MKLKTKYYDMGLGRVVLGGSQRDFYQDAEAAHELSKRLRTYQQTLAATTGDDQHARALRGVSAVLKGILEQ